MCVRYCMYDEVSDPELALLLRHAAQTAGRLAVNMRTSGDVRPTDLAPVIAPSREGRRPDAFPMQWGFVHPRRGMLVFNTRYETAREKELFYGSVDDRRCLIPASCFYEWKKTADGNKERYIFRAGDGGTLFLAGLYVIPAGRRGLPCFSVLTRDADRSVRELHPRTPVLIPRSRAEEWLSRETDFLGVIRDVNVEIAAAQG